MDDSQKGLRPPVENLDDREYFRCPHLGGPVPFRYCRKLLEGLPCRRVFECWRNEPEVLALVEVHYDREHLESVWSRPPQTKAVTLAEIIERARKNQK